MKLEEQVTSLELAKELKKAGYPEEGLWWWVSRGITSQEYTLEQRWSAIPEDNNIVAPTVAELGEALRQFQKNRWISWHEDDDEYKQGKWRSGLVNGGYEGMAEWIEFECANTEADARAKMWLYLK